tara:strand:- start:1524 stop:2285 length:762 start_codon:yes stop_codon:yes gene_type:complete
MSLTYLTFSLTFFGPPSITIKSGAKATLYGNGPPVLFSSGLYGSMPKFLYNDLFSLMKRNVTFVKLDRPFETPEILKEVVDALGVEKVGFFSHSSFNPNVLTSPLLSSAVLCDPVVFPTIGFGSDPFMSPELDITVPVLSIRAELSYDKTKIDSSGIPNYLEPRPIDSSKWKSELYEGVGHADMLDDVWADLGSVAIPWIHGPTPPKQPFLNWSPTSSKTTGIKNIRKEYRATLAAMASDHLLSTMDILPPVV